MEKEAGEGEGEGAEEGERGLPAVGGLPAGAGEGLPGMAEEENEDEALEKVEKEAEVLAAVVAQASYLASSLV